MLGMSGSCQIMYVWLIITQIALAAEIQHKGLVVQHKGIVV